MQINGRDIRQQVSEERMKQRKVAETFARLIANPDWQVMVEYLNWRGTVLMQGLLAPTQGGDGMSIALSAERNKGALQEIQSIPQYISSIIAQDAQARKSEGIPDDEVAPKSSPPTSEADFSRPNAAAQPVETK